MRKQMSGIERRPWIDKLLDHYKDSVWHMVCVACDVPDKREELFVQVFTLAVARLNRQVIEQKSFEPWFEGLFNDAVEITLNRKASFIEELTVETNADPASEAAEPSTPSNEHNPDCVPSALLARTEQMMRATIAMEDALRHHKGPLWAKLGAIGLVLLGVAGVGYGMSERVYAQFQHPSTHTTNGTTTPLPKVTGDLPVEPTAMYSLDNQKIDLNHSAVDDGHVYLGTLIEDTDTWPRIDVQKVAFGTSSQTADSLKGPTSSIELVVPMQNQQKTQVSTSGWTIANWRIDSMQGWIVAVVHWHNPAFKAGDVVQIYGLSKVSNQFSLMDTLTPETGIDNQFVVAVGSDKIAIQSAVNDSAGGAPLGLPIELYQLNGTDPLHAWNQIGQIPASFGLMQDPIATSEGLVFQGVSGKSATDGANETTWYELSYSGGLTRLYGPPVDGQSHWAVRGTTGSTWWVETTPDATQKGMGYQVSMSPLTPTKPSNAARNLNEPVQQLTAENGYILWVEGLDSSTDRLVVAKVE